MYFAILRLSPNPKSDIVFATKRFFKFCGFKSYLLVTPNFFSVWILTHENFKDQKTYKICKFHIFCKILLPLLPFAFITSKAITLKKFETYKCLSIIYISLKIIFRTRLGFMHFNTCYIPVYVYLSRPTILSALNMIGTFETKSIDDLTF